MSSILILAGFHLATAPRVVKEADALAAAGHEVTVLALRMDPVLSSIDEEIARTKQWRLFAHGDLLPDSLGGRLRNFSLRLHAKLGRLSVRHFGYVTPDALGYAVRTMLEKAARVNADLTVVHSEGGLWVGRELLNRGYRVGVDFEDWFSEDLLEDARRDRPIGLLRSLEEELLKRCTYRITTSQAMAEALASAYASPLPEVIYNCFPLSEREKLDGLKKDKIDAGRISLHWFSQTIGAGRGLEQLFAALPKVTSNLEIHIRGTPDFGYEECINRQTPPDWRGRIYLHPRVPPWELTSRIAEHDIGFAFESRVPPSRDLTITNKIFQYMLGGLGIVASDTSGQREALRDFPGAAVVLNFEDTQRMAETLNSLVEDRSRLEAMKQESIRAVTSRFNSEQQQDVYARLAEAALRADRPRV